MLPACQRRRRRAVRRFTSLHGEPLEERSLLTLFAQLVADINPTGGAFPSPIYRSQTVVGNLAYFSANDGTTGIELWKTDGTAAGTVLVKDILPGPGNSYPRFLSNVNGTLYFLADDGVSGRELWRSDGTAAGTNVVK